MKRHLPYGAALAGAALLALGAGAVATAQPTPPAADAGRPAAHTQMREHMRERVEARAKQVHDALNLRPGQEAAWQAMVGEVRAGFRHDGPRGERPNAAAMTTPERLDFMAARMAEHQARFQRTAAAVKRFYAQLDPQQQKVFDAVAGRGMGMMGGRGGMHRGMGGHMGPHKG